MSSRLATTAVLMAMLASPAVAQSFVSSEDEPPIADAIPWQGSFDFGTASPDPDSTPAWRLIDFTDASQVPV